MAIEDEVKTHDREIGKLFVATERLVDGQEKMNDKMDKLIDNTNKYDVLMAKLVNTTEHFQDSMARAYVRIEKIENKQNTSGCAAFQQSMGERKLILDNYEDKIAVVNKRLAQGEEWREWVNKALIGKAVAIIGLLLGLIYEGVSK